MGTRSPDKRPPLSRRAVCCRTVAASFQYCSSGRVWWTRKSTGCGSVWSASAPSRVTVLLNDRMATDGESINWWDRVAPLQRD